MENICRIYTKGKEKGIKTYHYKKSKIHETGGKAIRDERREKATRHMENN